MTALKSIHDSLENIVPTLEERKNGNVSTGYEIKPEILLQLYREKRQMYVNTWHMLLLEHKIAVATADEPTMTNIKKRLADMVRAIEIIDKEISTLE